MKSLIIFPPHWNPISPHLAPVLLASQLENSGFETDVRDINAEFFRKILARDYMDKKVIEFFKLGEQLSQEVLHIDSSENNLSEELQEKLAKFQVIKNYTAQNIDDITTIPAAIEDAVCVFKSKEHFYNPDLLSKAEYTINMALQVISRLYYPTIMTLNNFSVMGLDKSFEGISKIIGEPSKNVYHEFYEEIIPEIIEKDYDFITVSIASSSQILGGLSLAKMLKSRTNAHVNIGGNFIGRIKETVENKEEFFEFAHTYSYGEGEKAIIKLAESIKDNTSLKKVPNLIYKNKGGIHINPECEITKPDEIVTPDLGDCNLDLYLTPEIIMPVQASKGCYWGKCTFCDHFHGQQYYMIKDINKTVDEMAFYNEKYGITKFEFVDECLSPAYIDKLSDAITKKGLEVDWFCESRLEKAFNSKLLKKARKAGLRQVLWGLESGSEKVLKDMNKGTNNNDILKVLKASREADIWNFAFIFLGFPTETKADAEQTINFVCNNTSVICSATPGSPFSLTKHSYIRNNPDQFGITKIIEDEREFSTSSYYKAEKGMSGAEIVEAIKKYDEERKLAYGDTVVSKLKNREYIFLYVSKHGVDKVVDM